MIVIWRYIECWSSEVRVTFCHCIWSRKMTLTVTGEKLWGGSSFIFTILICCTGLSTLCPILMMKRFWKEQEDSYFVDQLVSAPSSETLFSRLLCMLHRSNSLPYILICVRYVTYCLCFHEIGNCFSPLAAVREDENQLCHGIQTISGIGIQSRLQLIFEFLIAFLLSPFPKDTNLNMSLITSYWSTVIANSTWVGRYMVQLPLHCSSLQCSFPLLVPMQLPLQLPKSVICFPPIWCGSQLQHPSAGFLGCPP